MSRSKWKHITINNSNIQTRANLITPYFYNKLVRVYNGKQLKEILIGLDCINQKFGELVITKTVPKYKSHDK